MTAHLRLDRQVFKTSRLLEFCSVKELVLQTGHPVDQWPLVIVFSGQRTRPERRRWNRTGHQSRRAIDAELLNHGR